MLLIFTCATGTEPDSSHGDLFEGGGLFVRKQLKLGGLFEEGLLEGHLLKEGA